MQFIYPFDAIEICKITSSEVEDGIAWHYENHRVFSVRSAYKLATSTQSHDYNTPTSSFRGMSDQTICDLIWKTNVSEKVRSSDGGLLEILLQPK